MCIAARSQHLWYQGLLQKTRSKFGSPSRPAHRAFRQHSTRAQSGQACGFARRGLLGSFLLTGAVMASASSSGFFSMAAAAADSNVAKVLQDPKWPPEPPYDEKDFQRFDESPDSNFYSQPRFVTHIDDKAIQALTSYYEKTLPKAGTQDAAVLDICSSWICHYPLNYSLGRIAGLGMNEEELARNAVLTEYAVKDLNVEPKLPYEDNSFDVVTNAVSVDYLARPMEVFREMHRVLKPGGRAIMSFSNRCFPTKAVAIWTSTGDVDHCWIVGSYYHYSVPGGWSPPEALDISPSAGLFGRTDPMYVVTATKLEA